MTVSSTTAFERLPQVLPQSFATAPATGGMTPEQYLNAVRSLQAQQRGGMDESSYMSAVLAQRARQAQTAAAALQLGLAPNATLEQIQRARAEQARATAQAASYNKDGEPLRTASEADFAEVLNKVGELNPQLASRLSRQMDDIRRDNPGGTFAQNWATLISQISRQDASRGLELQSIMNFVLSMPLPTTGSGNGGGKQLREPTDNDFAKVLDDLGKLNPGDAATVDQLMRQITAQNPGASFADRWNKLLGQLKQQDPGRAAALEGQMNFVRSQPADAGTTPPPTGGTTKTPTAEAYTKVLDEIRRLNPTLAADVDARMTQIREDNPGASFADQWKALVDDFRKTDESRAIALESQMRFALAQG